MNVSQNHQRFSGIECKRFFKVSSFFALLTPYGILFFLGNHFLLERRRNFFCKNWPDLNSESSNVFQYILLPFLRLDNWNVSNKWMVCVFSITFIIFEKIEMFAWYFDCITTKINSSNVILDIMKIMTLTNTIFYLLMETISCHEYMSFLIVI